MNHIEKTVRDFFEDANNVHPSGFLFHRYASFDYCYNYFHPSRPQIVDDDNNMEKSCLVLGMYLASWGMYRGSGFLLKKISIKHFKPIIEYIQVLRSEDKKVWKLDVDKYSDETIGKILGIYDDIKKELRIEEMGQKEHGTLVTKAMLGVFGIVPAFDTRFCDTFAKMYEKCGFSSKRLNKKSMECIRDFYEKNDKIIDDLSENNFIMDFRTGKPTKLKYSKAKIIDMYGFQKSTKSE